MYSQGISDKNNKKLDNKQDIKSRKTKSYNRGNNSDKNNSNNKNNNIKNNQIILPITYRDYKSQKNNKKYIKQSKCNSQYDYSIGYKKQQNDRKTQINKKINKIKNQLIEQDLQNYQLIRQGIIKDKIQIKSKKRIISHDILHPPITINKIKNNRQDKILQLQQTQSQNIQQKQYEQIANQLKLINLQSKVVNYNIDNKKQQTFLAKIQQSQSQVITSPLNNQKIGNSPQTLQNKIVSSKYNQKSIQQMKSNEQDNESIKQNNKNQQKQQNKNIKQIDDKIIQKNNNNNITIKIDKDNNENNNYKQLNKLSIVQKIIEQKIQININNQQQQQNIKLNQEINYLKSTVRSLKLQKIKALADINIQKQIKIQSKNQSNKNRYQIFNSSINQKSIDISNPVFLGKIRKNRSLSRKNQNHSLRSQELTAEKQLDLPHPIINNQKFSTKIKINSFLSERKNTENEDIKYKTMNLQRISQEQLQQSVKIQGNLATSVDMPVFGTNLRSNKINMRGLQISNKVLNKFELEDKDFKKFINFSSIKNKNKIISDNQQYEINQKIFQGVIIKNNIKKINIQKESKKIQINSINLITDGQKINLKKKLYNFQDKIIPQIPKNPNYTTQTGQIMELILQILPYSNLSYGPDDLTDCILKKYKNCLMFEMKRFVETKIVWYYNGKLYIGQWDNSKNEKCGFGRQFSQKSYYQGNFKNNKRNGNGKFISETILYEGQWINGQKCGYGRYKNQQQNIYYEGEWKNDKKQGKGHYQFQGNIYYGIFQNNIKQGFGVQQFKNGDRYIGFYSHGKFQGEGKYIWYNRSFYLGNFSQGYREGKGYWQSGIQNYQIYIGQFYKDKKQGSGRYVWSNRCVYQGNFFNDLKHGLGSVSYPDGRYVEGIWTQGILTQVLSKLSEANKQDPLQFHRSTRGQSKTFIRVAEL